MDSRIILTKADFSANNIGQIVELSDLTKKVLAKQTQYDEGDDEAVHLNTFLNELSDNGFIGGENPILNLLFIPCLANSHGELMYNIARLDSDGYPTDSMSSDEASAAEASQAYWPVTINRKIVGMRSHYFEGGATKSQLEFNSYTLAEQGSKMKSFTFVMYRLGEVTTGASVIFANSNGGPIFTLSTTVAKVTYGGNNIMYANINNSKLSGFSGISYKSGEGFEALLDKGTIGTSTYNSEVTDVDANNNVFFPALGIQENNLAMPIIAIGNYMTPTQLLSFRAIVNTFLASMNIITA